MWVLMMKLKMNHNMKMNRNKFRNVVKTPKVPIVEKSSVLGMGIVSLIVKIYPLVPREP